ncbi:MAG: hypothetical protein KKF48_01690 [Nanoarchaeota archaeon]|nr:hypothetical protein [Nanoarchaeota archaeon]MBU1027733.1 hypothetical protein [Nanoarchaeota archaeon]
MKNKRGEKINFKYNMSEYWSILKKYKSLFFPLLVISLVVEALFTADKFLFKKIIDDGTEFLAGNIIQNVFIQTLIILALIFASIVILRTIGKWIIIQFMNVLTSRQIKDIKTKYFNHILRLSHNFHTTHKTGSLISRLGRGSGAVETMTDILVFNIAPLVFQLFVVGISLAYFSISSALTILIVAILFISYSFYIQQK